jgi:hypothetical protein
MQSLFESTEIEKAENSPSTDARFIVNRLLAWLVLIPLLLVLLAAICGAFR